MADVSFRGPGPCCDEQCCDEQCCDESWSGGPGSGGPGVLAPHAAWQRLRDMRTVVAHQPAIAHAVGCLPLCDQLELTLELLRQAGWPDFELPEDDLPPNVIRFRPRVCR